MIAILIDQALTVARQKALALEPFVEIGRIGGVSLRQPRVDDLDSAAQIDAEIAGGFAHTLLATDQQRSSQPLLNKAQGRADDLLLLAFGEDDALRAPPQPIMHPLQTSRRRDRAASADATGRLSMSVMGRRATPVSIAALATAGGT